MNCIQINDNWRILGEPDEGFVDLPFDALIYRERDYSTADGGKNGFYRGETLILEKKAEFPRCNKISLLVEGVCGAADIYVDGGCLGTVTHGGKYEMDISSYAGGIHTVRMEFVSPDCAPCYTGLGVSGGVRLYTADNPLYIGTDGVSVTTLDDDARAELLVGVDVVNDSDRPKSFVLNVRALNAKGKHVAKKSRKLKIAPNCEKRFYVPLKMTRHYNWSIDDAYLYTMAVSVCEGETVCDESEAVFGIRTSALDEQKGFLLSGKPFKFRGAHVAHDNGIIGKCSLPSAEKAKAAALKESGFNSVRYVGVPTECALDALDRAGLICVADIFGVLAQPKSVCDGHLFFRENYKQIIESSVKTLRKHPCVAAYGICDCPPESYGRGEGAALAAEIVRLIKQYDDSRFIIASAAEMLPSPEEMLKAGARADRVRAAEMTGGLLSLSREKNMFRDFTANYFDTADAAGYAFLYPRYQSDKMVSSRHIIGVASRPDKAFEALDEADKNGVLGDFVSPAIDCLGCGERGDGMSGKRCCDSADLDLTLNRKPRSYYREICMGAKNKSYIVVCDPENEEDESAARHSWNWPRYLGKPVTVKVYTSGDVVALYLDGKLIGRKLAGKINKHTATFKVNYYPGKLEAVSLHRGVEHSRCSLESVSSPKALKLSCQGSKSVSLSDGNLAFVQICVTDKDGRFVSKAQREVEVSVIGDGELYALSNADPFLQSAANIKTIPVYEGRATAAVRGTAEGKMTVKVVSDGLLSNKITVKVKP